MVKYGSGFPLASSFARKKSFHPELVRDWPNRFAVNPKYPATRTFPEGSVVAKLEMSVLVHHHCFAQVRLPVEESLATKASSELQELMKV